MTTPSKSWSGCKSSVRRYRQGTDFTPASRTPPWVAAGWKCQCRHSALNRPAATKLEGHDGAQCVQEQALRRYMRYVRSAGFQSARCHWLPVSGAQAHHPPWSSPLLRSSQGPFSREHTDCTSFGAFMNFSVTLAAESDQVALVIRALMAPELLVMNFDCGKRATRLAAPAVTL